MAGLANYSKPPARDRSEAAVAYLKLYNALQMIGWISACLITLAGLYMRLPVWILAGFTVREPQLLPALVYLPLASHEHATDGRLSFCEN